MLSVIGAPMSADDEITCIISPTLTSTIYLPQAVSGPTWQVAPGGHLESDSVERLSCTSNPISEKGARGLYLRLNIIS